MIGMPIKPMLAKAAPAPALGQPWPYPFGKPAWVFEQKFNGYRMTAHCRPGEKPTIWSRPGRVVTDEFVELHDVLSQVSAEMVIDGEVCLLRDGKPSFQGLAGRGRLPKAFREDAMRLYVFDLLALRDQPLLRLPLVDRKNLLADWLMELGLPVQLVVPTPEREGREGHALWQAATDDHGEGVIAKPLQSLYRPGERGTWLKFKVKQRGVFLIAGFTAGEGENAGLFGALVLAKAGETEPFVYAGKAGTGFTTHSAEMLLREMRDRQIADPPFTKRQMLKVKPHIGPRAVTWVLPQLQAEIEYGDLSDEGFPIWPSFKGLVG